MKVRLLTILEEIRSSYWFVPALLAAASVGLAVTTLSIDQRAGASLIENIGWVWGGGADGARGLLSTVAGSTITVAGVVFSITIVALSLASSQFGPRLLRQFMRSRTNQVVLGTFVATFIYSLLILRTVRTEDGSGTVFVPHVSVTTSLILMLLSLGVLIYFIHHTARAVQAPVVIADVADDLFGTIERIFPTGIGCEPPAGVTTPQDDMPANFHAEALPVLASESGYLQAIDNQKLIEVAADADLVLYLNYRPGHFVICENPLLEAWPSERLTQQVAEDLQRAFVVGRYRTQTQDVEFAIDQLVEVAIRALSPSLNDTFTAMSCVDWLGAALRRLADQPFPSPYRYDEQGRLRVFAERRQSFADLVDAAFNLIRQNAQDNPAVQIRLLEALAAIAGCDSLPDNAHDALLSQARMIERAARDQLEEKRDVADVLQRYRQVLEELREE